MTTLWNAEKPISGITVENLNAALADPVVKARLDKGGDWGIEDTTPVRVFLTRLMQGASIPHIYFEEKAAKVFTTAETWAPLELDIYAVIKILNDHLLVQALATAQTISSEAEQKVRYIGNCYILMPYFFQNEDMCAHMRSLAPRP